MQSNLHKKISELAESVLSSTDFYLISVEIKGANQPEVWIVIDGAERDVNMQECSEISGELNFLMEAHDLFNGAYRLNVSSPGLSRPLVDQRQYLKNKGRKVKIKYKTDEGYYKTSGILKDASPEHIVVDQEEGNDIELSFNQIIETKIIPSFK